MVKSGDIIGTVDSFKKEVLMEENGDKKPSVRDDISNQRRGGTWMDPHHVAHAAANPERTLQFYKNAARSTNPVDQEYWLARVFNNHNVAMNIAYSVYAKEMNSMTMDVGDVDELLTDFDNSSVSGTRSFKVKLKDEMRDPEDIAGDNETVRLLYQAIDSKWPNRPINKMILTYILIKGNNAHNIKFDLPYMSNVMNVLDRIEKDKKSWLSATNFMEYAGITRKMWETVIAYLIEVTGNIT